VRNHPVKVLLLVEDNEGDARLLHEMFHEEGHESHNTTLTHVQSLAEAEKSLLKGDVDIVLLDLGLPDEQGIAVVKRAQAAAPRVPLVVLTGTDDEVLAAEALHEGAQDYLIKGQIEARGLFRALRYAIERKLMEEALFEEKERAQVTLRSIGDGVVCADNQGNVTFLNLVAERTTGWSLQEAIGRPMVEIFRTRDGSHGEAVETTAEVAMLQIRSMHMPSSSVLICRDGTTIPIEESIAPIHNRGGEAMGAVIVFRDVSAARATAMQIAHSAQHDFLTGLPNRMLLNDRIDQAIIIARRSQLQVAVLFVDLDGFKHINDSLGHPMGDEVLKSVAMRLVSCVRSTDTVSRQGGDEFVVLMAEVTRPADAAAMAVKILEALSKAHCIDDHDLHVTASIGISTFPGDGMNAEALIKNADTAMYQTKENGRQGFRFFTPAMNAKAVERQSIEEDLRRALRRHEFTMHYQPKICLRTMTIIGAEALIRWMHPTRGALVPAQFIPIAEDSGLIISIGKWAMREACLQAQRWVEAGYRGVSVAVNVSALELREGSFLEGMLAILRDTHLQPGLLELELTESVLMKRVEPTIIILKILRERGVHVAIDDFGTGYSSLSYLRKFPIDTLKIDQSFVSQIASGGGDSAIVTAVISMARSLNLRVVAEGVESQAELDFLQSHQCDEGQGFYFSRPVPALDFMGLLQHGIRRPISPKRVASVAAIPRDMASKALR
jgi:diguanylate cyclase (GGDEF)-like protein/PAS domain S-box-containing protein